MADQTRRPDTKTIDGGVDPHQPSGPGVPRWVRVSLIIVVALILLFVVLHLTGVLSSNHGLGPSMPTMNTP